MLLGIGLLRFICFFVLSRVIRVFVNVLEIEVVWNMVFGVID